MVAQFQKSLVYLPICPRRLSTYFQVIDLCKTLLLIRLTELVQPPNQPQGFMGESQCWLLPQQISRHPLEQATLSENPSTLYPECEELFFCSGLIYVAHEKQEWCSNDMQRVITPLGIAVLHSFGHSRQASTLCPCAVVMGKISQGGSYCPVACGQRSLGGRSADRQKYIHI